MSAQVTVIHKESKIDGQPIEWNVLAITAYIDGDFQTLEIKLNKTETLLTKILLGSDEEKPEQTSHKSTEQEQTEFNKKTTVKKAKNILEEDELDSGLFD